MTYVPLAMFSGQQLALGREELLSVGQRVLGTRAVRTGARRCQHTRQGARGEVDLARGGRGHFAT